MLKRPILHWGYAVGDIERAVDFWVSAFGAGPFFVLEHIPFDEVGHRGQPGLFDHTAAFGQCGPIAVELQQVFDVEPPSLADGIVPHGLTTNHVAFISPDLEGDSRRLELAGMPKLLTAKTGPVEVIWHDAPLLGHAIEIHKETEHVHALFAALANAANRWDGREPLRVGPPGG